MSKLEETKIFKKLKKLDNALASDVLKNSNSIIELINKKTTINFPNYTNHDVRHSISILNTMHDLIKDNEDFSALEYALMVYSAMFHDIGMTISDDEIKKIKVDDSKYLYNQSFKLIKKNLNNNEELAIQEVVRSAHGKIAHDLITTQYKEFFKLPSRSIYFDEDLGIICQAHTEGKHYLEQLATEKSKGNYTYNPRFIAILLRVADILDIDDTRTPIELYKSIDLNDYSNEEWQKNFVIENSKKIHKRNKLKEIRLEGTCENIKIHRKLLNYIKCIENELSILVNMTSDMKNEYQININTDVKNNIVPKGYTIPDLKLNMDYHAVTNLLMGEAIYGSKNLGLRELLQNSIDSIMVKKDKLEINNHPLKNNYEPTIDIDIDEKNNKITIKDNGMGMNEHIITNYFLNIGKSYYKSKDFINYTHNYNPIGNFGIGFLSCFMLSNNVNVETKYFNSNKKYTIDLEKNSEYIAFKEITENNNLESGTKIILDLDMFCNALKSDFKVIHSDIVKFINQNILLNNFTINLNKEKIDNKIFKEVNSEYEIDIKEYSNNISGYIKLSQTKHSQNLKSLCNDSTYIVYFNGKEFIQLNDFMELNLEEIIHGFDLEYISIPIVDINTLNDFSVLINTGYHDISDVINLLERNNDINSRIYLFIHKSCYYSDNSEGDENDTIFWTDTFQSEEKDYILKDILNILPDIDSSLTPVFTYHKVNTLLLNSEILPFEISKSSFFLFTNLYLKNIKITSALNLGTIITAIQINEISMNINDNNIIPNISRTDFTKDSLELLSYAIGKIIHDFAFKEFDLNENQKQLLKFFNTIFYKNDSILLK